MPNTCDAASSNALIEALYNDPPWAQRLPTQLPSVPTSLRQFLQDYSRYGRAYATARFCNPEKLIPPASVAPYMSGERHRALAANDHTVDLFIAELFHQIQAYSPVTVELAGWDLYHGHLVPYRSSNAYDLCILFHAKEFPKDYRTSRYGETYPLGHEAMGGDADVRLGSQCCSTDEDFHLRNYIWLMSTNSVWLLNPRDEAFVARWVPCREFFTLHEATLTGPGMAALGDVNYFPSLSEYKVLWSLRESFSPSLLVRHALQRGGDSEAHLLINGMSLSELQNMVTMLTTTNEPSNVFQAHIPETSRESVLECTKQALLQREREIECNNQAELEKLLKRSKALSREVALTLLDRTKSSSGNWSEFRASNLLEVVSGKNRRAEFVAMWGSEDRELSVAAECLDVAFYPESALEALQLLDKEPNRTPRDAAAYIVARNEKLTRALFAAQGGTKQLVREAKAAVENLEYEINLLDARNLIAKIEELVAKAMSLQATKEQVKCAEGVLAHAVQIHNEIKQMIRVCMSGVWVG